MTTKDINTMFGEKGQICISVIVPTNRFSPERQEDHVETEKAIEAAKKVLQNKYPEENNKILENALDELAAGIDYNHNKEGIGLFVSPYINKMVQFPFPVKKKIVVDRSFEMRDILYTAGYQIEYFLLQVSENVIRLFKGTGENLEEVTDKNFPSKQEEEFIYNKPSASTSYAGYAHVKSFEKDKSELEWTRQRNNLNNIDKLLGKYLQPGTPLLISGPGKAIPLFEEVSNHRTNIMGTITGNYNYSGLHELEMLAWPKMRSFIEEKKLDQIKEYKEKIGQKMGVEGVEAVWDAAREGRGLRLLVEKNFSIPAYLSPDGNKLFLRPTRDKYTFIADIVDNIIETVLEKNGELTILEDGLLSDYGKIALITRY